MVNTTKIPGCFVGLDSVLFSLPSTAGFVLDLFVVSICPSLRSFSLTLSDSNLPLSHSLSLLF